MSHSLIRLLFVFVLLLSFSLWSAFETPPQETEIHPTINMLNISKLPKNFRIPSDLGGLLDNPRLAHGLEHLNMSGSSQFSLEGLKQIQEALKGRDITIVDLRQESHGFINGAAISWRSEHNWGNVGKRLEEILEDEQEHLSKALKEGVLNIPQKYAPIQLQVATAETEEAVVKSLGLKYIRFPVADHWRPTNEIIDAFVQLMKTFPSDQWLHFHCAAGKGRTTTFITMADMMRHASELSLEEIIQRQHQIGGTDLMASTDSLWKKKFIQQRIDFFIQFYQYCLESPDFEETWTSWSSRSFK